MVLRADKLKIPKLRLLRSPSSPRLAKPAKYGVPSESKNNACNPSWPTAQRTIDRLLGRGSSYQRFNEVFWETTISPTVFNPNASAFP